ncbi:MAG: recombinase family protein [Anaerorhabdus sp.]
MKNNVTIGYTRVSTEEQARDGYSLKAQRLFIEQYASESKFKGLNILEDNGYSAKDENRPRYKKLLNLIKYKEISTIIIHKIDRLSKNITDFNNFVNLCSANNVNLTFITDSINFNSAVGRGTYNIMISIDQMEREQISERTKAGYIVMLENGEYPFGGKLPLGISKTKDKKLYYNEDINIVKKIKDLNLYDKVSLKEIETIMKNKYPNKNLKWGKSSVERILKNPIYQGIITYNDNEYRFLDSLFTKDEICQINKKNETFKYLKTTK